MLLDEVLGVLMIKLVVDGMKLKCKKHINVLALRLQVMLRNLSVKQKAIFMFKYVQIIHHMLLI